MEWKLIYNLRNIFGQLNEQVGGKYVNIKYCNEICRLIFLNWLSIINKTSQKLSGKQGQEFSIQKNFNSEKLV